MKFLILCSLAVLALGSEETLSFHGKDLEVVDKLSFKYSMDKLIVKTVCVDEGLVSLEIPREFGMTTREIKSEPDLPVLREYVALPHLGEWKVVVEDVVTVKHDLNGQRVIPSKGELFLADDPKDFPLVFGKFYSTPQNLPIATLIKEVTIRDVSGNILEINPIMYDPTNAMLEIVTSCTIKLVSSQVSEDVESKIVDATWFDLYSFHFINFDHFAGTRFIKGDKADLGRMMVFYESKFKDSAEKYATWKKTQGLTDVILGDCGSDASSIKSKISAAYKESASLTYAVLFGTRCPTFNCQKSKRECDCQYAQMGSGAEVSVFVSRIPADSQTDADVELSKFQGYSAWEANATADWKKVTAGLALDLMGDEYKYMHRNLDAMTKWGFTKADYMQDNTATSTHCYQDWNTGLSLYYYIGHGSGTAWNCPQKTGGWPGRSLNSKLTNKAMLPFVLECSCLNGGFKKQNPCYAASMLNAANGGALSMYSSAPVATSSSPKDLQSGATDAMTSGKATRVGAIYYAGIMYAYKLKPSQCLYTLQGYNMFGDPSLELNFLKK